MQRTLAAHLKLWVAYRLAQWAADVVADLEGKAVTSAPAPTPPASEGGAPPEHWLALVQGQVPPPAMRRASADRAEQGTERARDVPVVADVPAQPPVRAAANDAALQSFRRPRVAARASLRGEDESAQARAVVRDRPPVTPKPAPRREHAVHETERATQSSWMAPPQKELEAPCHARRLAVSDEPTARPVRVDSVREVVSAPRATPRWPSFVETVHRPTASVPDAEVAQTPSEPDRVPSVSAPRLDAEVSEPAPFYAPARHVTRDTLVPERPVRSRHASDAMPAAAEAHAQGAAPDTWCALPVPREAPSSAPLRELAYRARLAREQEGG